MLNTNLDAEWPIDGTPGPAARTRPARLRVHSLPVRLTHWLTALAIVVMIGSGWRIYDWDPIFPWLWFPFWVTLGGQADIAQRVHNEEGLAGALQWHFAGMWLLGASFLAYLLYGLVSGHFRRSLFPLTPRAVLRDLGAALTGRLDHHVGARNAVQKLLYLGVILVILVMLLSGLGIWKPVQLAPLTALFGGYDTARVVHFLGMAAILGFLVVHLSLVALVPRVLPPMVIGTAPAHDAEPGRAAP
jgi:thiosulfate reductase cytochrome b subunit